MAFQSKGIILKSVAQAPLILGVPKEAFYALGIVLGVFMTFQIYITGFAITGASYGVILKLAHEDPYCLDTLLAALRYPQPQSRGVSKDTGFLRRAYNA